MKRNEVIVRLRLRLTHNPSPSLSLSRSLARSHLLSRFSLVFRGPPADSTGAPKQQSWRTVEHAPAANVIDVPDSGTPGFSFRKLFAFAGKAVDDAGGRQGRR